MKVVFDASPLADARRHAGVGRYVERLSAELENVGGLELHLAFPGSPPRGEGRGRRYLGAQPTLLSAAARVRPDIVHATGSEAMLAWPLRRQVVTVHDVYPWATVNSGTDPRLRAYLAWQRRRLRRAAGIIAVSESVAREVQSLLGVAGDRVHVVPEGVSDIFRPDPAPDDQAMRRRAGVEGAGYVLWVGSLRARDPRKGLDILLGGLHGGRHRLVLVGDPGAEAERVRGAAELAGIDVTLTGRVPDEDLAAIYRGAGVVAVPSLDEGFGLPLLEAMASGAPVVASVAGNLPDLAADAAILVPPGDADALAAGIAEVLGDPKLAARLSELGPIRAAGFTWAEAARQTAAVYGRVVGSDWH